MIAVGLSILTASARESTGSCFLAKGALFSFTPPLGRSWNVSNRIHYAYYPCYTYNNNISSNNKTSKYEGVDTLCPPLVVLGPKQ